MTPSPSQPSRTGAEQLDELLPLLRTLVADISDDVLDRPTPCAAFTVTGVLEHMIGGATAFAPAFRGQSSGESAPTGSIQQRFHHAMAELGDAVHAKGAADRTISAPFGEVPGDSFARYVAFDGVVHGWDLSMAAGQPFQPDDALVAEIDAFVRGLLTDAMRDGDTFAEAVDPPANASPLEQLVAFSGRNPRFGQDESAIAL